MEAFPLLIRADAMPGMGSGHVMRCRALAAAARAAGLPVSMGGHGGISWLCPLLEQEKFLFLNGKCPSQEAPDALLTHLERMARFLSRPLRECAVVLDGYHFTTACQSAVRKAALALVVIDDYHHLPRYDCDILLNQNPGSEEYAYEDKTDVKLLGLDYALLRPEFKTPPPPAEQPRIVLLTLGGGDASTQLPALAAALPRAALSDRILQVIAGSMPADAIKNALSGVAARLEILPSVEDMPALLAETEICISAGGSTCWELCHMGIPFVTVEIAENQRRICAWLDAHGYARRFSSQAFLELAGNAVLRRTRAAALRTLVDGRGAERLIRRLRDLCLTNKGYMGTHSLERQQ